MKIHLNRAGQSLGQFNPDEVRAGFKDGKFTATDLAWRDGMPMWKPLAEVIDEIAPDAAPAESGVNPPALVAADGFPWEQRAEKGFLNALLETVRGVLFEPSKTFASMPVTGGYGAPLFFAVLLCSLSLLAAMFYQVVLERLNPAEAISPEQQQLLAFIRNGAFVGATIFLIPLFVLLTLFFTSALTHLSLIIVGGARRPFETTFRVIAYASGAVAVLELLPICGPYLIAPVWKFISSAIGLSKAHGISQGKAVFALVLPFLLCCVVPGVMAIFVLLVAMGVKLGAG